MRGSTDTDDPWLSTAEIAEALGESAWLVRKSFRNPDRADELYGKGNWDDSPSVLSTKRVFRARQSAVLRLAERAANASGK